MDEFESFLRSLKSAPDRGTINSKLSELVKVLNYDANDLFFDISSTSSPLGIVEAAIKPGETSSPHIVIITDYTEVPISAGYVMTCGYGKKEVHWYQESLRTVYRDLLPEAVVYLRNDQCWWFDGKDVYYIPYATMNSESVEQLYDLIEKPDNFSEDEEDRIEYIRRFHKSHFETESDILSVKIEKENYKLDLEKYWAWLREAQLAETNTEKGRALERVASIMFSGLPFIEVRDTNVRTTSAEVDVVLEYQPPQRSTVFDSYDRFILVECKNWQDPVGSKVIRDFAGKMNSVKADFGILVSYNGITGEEGRDAVVEIDQLYQRENKTIIVLTAADLKSIIGGQSLYDIIDDKIFRRRFRTLYK